MDNLEKLSKEIADLEGKRAELTLQLEGARADVVTEQAASGAALLQGTPIDMAGKGLVKAQDRITVLENALSQLAANIEAAKVRLKAEIVNAETLEMARLGKLATVEGDKVSDELISVVRRLEKIQLLFDQAVQLKVPRCDAFSVNPVSIIRRVLGCLDGVSFANANSRAKAALSQIELEGKYIRISW